MKSLIHTEKAFNILFIRSELDDYILRANEFRVYSHLARRAGADGAYPAVESMAKRCRLHEDTVRRCLRRLRDLNLVRAEERRGDTTRYRLTSLSEWKSPPSEQNDSPTEAPSDNDPRVLRRKGRRKDDSHRTLIHGEKGFNILFIRSELDDYILTANEFRIYAHLARRAGNDWAWPSVDAMAKKCYLHEDTVRTCLRRLKELNLVKAHSRSGDTTFYTLTSLSEWKSVPTKKNPSESKGAPPDSESSTPKQGDGSTPKAMEPKVYQEGNPSKDNTVAAPFADSETHPHSPTDAPTSSALPPNGSMMEAHHAALSQNSLSKGKNGSRPAQTPIHRKAYAIAARLCAIHWDNCKVRFSLHPARAYVEQALLEGHQEEEISSTYSRTLHYCHGVTTDEINRGERAQYERANCALTVTLAAESLSRDGKTSPERWAKVIKRLQEECRRQKIKEADIVQKISQASSAIAAWFARNDSTRGSELESQT